MDITVTESTGGFSENLDKEEMRQELLKYAERADEIDPMRAMQILTELYMENCGVCQGYCSVLYYAGWEWASRAGFSAPFCKLMPTVSEKYREHQKEYDEYDVLYVSPRDTCKIAINLFEGLDEEGRIALSAGILDDIMECE